MFVLNFYQDIYLSFLFRFRFCYVDDQLLLELLKNLVSNTSSILYDFFLKACVNMPFAGFKRKI